MFRRILAALTVLLVLTAAAGCSSDTKDDAEDAIESARDDVGDAVDDAKDDIGDKADQATARTAAETFRNTLRDDETGKSDGFRSIEAIENAGDDLPGDATMSGVDDADGDGFDDDGDVQIDVGDESACVRIPEDGDEIDVEGGAC